MNQSPLVSVIIPCYNQGKYLEHAVLSVLAQTYNNWECIIINDGSTDNTQEVAIRCCTLDKRIRYHSQENRGLSNARNEGLKRSSGAFIQLLDSDDLIEKEKLEKTIWLYSQVPPGVIIFSGSRTFDDKTPEKLNILGKSNIVSCIDLNLDDTLESQLALIRRRNHCVISAPLYPADVFKKVNCFDEGFTALEDWDFHVRCISAGYKFHYASITNGRTLIRLHEVSIMMDTFRMNSNQEKFNNKHQVFIVKTPIKQSKLDRLYRNFLPPFVTKIIPKFKALLVK